MNYKTYNNPKVSVIIPTYHRNRKFERAIKSVLNQTLKEFEVIIVDDNGPSSKFSEDVASIVNNFNVDKRIKLIQHEKNLGGCAARNTGIKESKSDIIAFLDDDDEWKPAYLEAMLETLHKKKSKSIGVLYSNLYYSIFGKYMIPKKESSHYSGYVFKRLVSGWCPPTTSLTIVKKKCFEEVGLFDTELDSFQDFDMWLRISKKYQFDYLDERLVIKHQFEDDQASINPKRRYKGLLTLKKKWSNLLDDSYFKVFNKSMINYEREISKRFVLYFIENEHNIREAFSHYFRFLKKGGWKRPSNVALLLSILSGERIFNLYQKLAYKKNFKVLSEKCD